MKYLNVSMSYKKHNMYRMWGCLSGQAGKGESLVGIHTPLRGFESSSRQAYYHCYLVIIHRPLIWIWGTDAIHLYLGNELQAWKDGECSVGSAETTLNGGMPILMQ